MAGDNPGVRVRERYTLDKFDGDRVEGAVPVETITVEVEDGVVVSVERKER
jgi:hypothetical protein